MSPASRRCGARRRLLEFHHRLHDKLDALRERDILARTDALDKKLDQLCSDVSAMRGG